MEQGRIGMLGGVCRQDTGIEDGAGGYTDPSMGVCLQPLRYSDALVGVACRARMRAKEPVSMGMHLVPSGRMAMHP